MKMKCVVLGDTTEGRKFEIIVDISVQV